MGYLSLFLLLAGPGSEPTVERPDAALESLSRVVSLVAAMVDSMAAGAGSRVSETRPSSGCAPDLLSLEETATYRVTYGIFGQVASATVSYKGSSKAGAPSVHGIGAGSGAFMGLGKSDNRIESDFDPGTRTARRWTHSRSFDNKNIVDSGEQESLGEVALLRKQTGQSDQTGALKRNTTVFDPLGLLLRLRIAPPETATTFEVLDGRALWRVEIAPLSSDPKQTGLLLFEGNFLPIDWNGNPDPLRKNQRFRLFLADDPLHTPVRLVMPMTLGEIRAELVRMDRPEDRRRRALASGLSCRLCSSCLPCPGSAVSNPMSAAGRP